MSQTAHIVTNHATLDLHDKHCEIDESVDVQEFTDGDGRNWPIADVRRKLEAIRDQVGNKVVNCTAGRSRSATFAVLYLWLTGPANFTLPQAIAAVTQGFDNFGKKIAKDLVETNLTGLLEAVNVQEYGLDRREKFDVWAARVQKGTAIAALLPLAH